METFDLSFDQLNEQYVPHGGSFVPQSKLQEKLLKTNAWQKIVEASNRQNPYAKRVMLSLRHGLQPMEADMAAIGLRETLSSSDLTSVTSELMNRRLLAQFASWENWNQAWRSYVPVAPSRPDFRKVYPVTVDGVDDGTADSPFVPEGAAFPYTSMTDAEFNYKVQKSIIGAKWTWELMVNDDLGATARLMQTVNRKIIGRHGRFITSLHTDASGPDATVYTAGNGNIVAGNPDLSQAALELAFETLGDRDGPDGEPIMLDGAVLVVGSQALVTIAREIQNVVYTDRADGTDVVRSTPTLPRFEIVYNPYIRHVATTANADTSWWLFPNTGGMNRPWAEFAFLQGFETPRMFRKRGEIEDMAGNAMPNMGSFHNFSHEAAVAWVYGGTVIEPIVTVASNGTNVP